MIETVGFPHDMAPCYDEGNTTSRRKKLMSERNMKASEVLAYPAASPAEAHRFFATKLSVETDASDVRVDLERGELPYVLLDARTEQSYEECHIPGAVSLPHRLISPETAARFDPAQLIVIYCWGPACNAATKAAYKLSAFGFQVKEMIGGLEYWRNEGGPVQGTLAEKAPLIG
jgi:rhodanese-related sulfurtransferase